MTPNTNNPREIYFNTDDIFSKISKILEKNGLQETPLDAALKEEESFTEIILRLTRDFIVSKISEEDFLISIQKQLGVTVIVAQNIIKDLKEKIIPFAEKASINEQKTEEKTIPIISPVPIGKIQTKKIPQINEVNEKKSKPIRNNNQTSDVKETKNIPRTGQDNYREPIE